MKIEIAPKLLAAGTLWAGLTAGSFAPAVQPAGHLYVAGTTGSSSYVERFALVDGEPQSNPDRTYSGVGWPIAVDASGWLYAVDAAKGAFGAPVVSFLGPTASPFSRTLTVWAVPGCPPGAGCSQEFLGIFAMLVDPQGYLYAATSMELYSTHTVYGIAVVAIYAPGASGLAIPAQMIVVDGCAWCTPAVTGMTLNARGDLIVPSVQRGPNQAAGPASQDIVTYTSPVTHPREARRLMLPRTFDTLGVALGTGTDLFVADSRGAGSLLAVYAQHASGSDEPRRELRIAGARSFGNGIAATDSRLFVPDPEAGAVYELDSRGEGLRRPLASLAVPTPLDVKLGP